MPAPTVLLNNQFGSDTQASGAGPATAIYGTQAATDSTGTVIDLSLDNPDLSSVLTDGSHVIWLVGTGGREFAPIVAVDNTAKTVTVDSDFAYPASLSGLSWAIGGKRKTIDGSSSLFNGDAGPGWHIVLENTGSDYTFSQDLVLSVTGVTVDGASENPWDWDWLFLRSDTGRVRLVATGDYRIHLKNAFLMHLEIVGPGAASSTKGALYTYYSSGAALDCVVNGFKYGFQQAQEGRFWAYGCEVHSCTTGCYANGSGNLLVLQRVLIRDNSSYGVQLYRLREAIIIQCLIIRNGSHGIHANFTNSGSIFSISGCTISDNSGDGVYLDNAAYYSPTRSPTIEQCVITNNGGYGISRANAAHVFGMGMYFKNAFYANTSGKYLNNMTYEEGTIDLTEDPFVDRLNGNYALNDAPGGGKLLKDAGWPQTWPGLPNTTSYPDIGAVESQAGSGSGSGGTLQGLPFARVFGGM